MAVEPPTTAGTIPPRARLTAAAMSAGADYWPDVLHLDCDAGAVSARAGRMVDTEARRHSDRRIREDRERLTRTLRSLTRWLRGGR